jgi:hypothetical protein
MKSFVVAQGKARKEAWLETAPYRDSPALEEEGYTFGLWLLEEASAPFLKGLARVLDEGEVRKKVGLGY